MKRIYEFLILFLVCVSCTKIISPSQDLFGEYDGEARGRKYWPHPPGTGTCDGYALTIHDKGKNQIHIFAGCSDTNTVLPRFDNLVIGKSQVDSVAVISFPNGPYVYKNIIYGIFNQTTKKQVGYILYTKTLTATNPPHSYNQTYYVYIPFMVSSNTHDTLTYYFGQRILKEVLE